MCFKDSYDHLHLALAVKLRNHLRFIYHPAFISTIAKATSLSDLLHLMADAIATSTPLMLSIVIFNGYYPNPASNYHVALLLSNSTSPSHLFHLVPTSISPKYQHFLLSSSPLPKHHPLYICTRIPASSLDKIALKFRETAIPKAETAGLSAQQWIAEALAAIETELLEAGDAEFYYARMMRFILKKSREHPLLPEDGRVGSTFPVELYTSGVEIV